MPLTEETPFEVMRRTWQPVGLSRDLEVGGTLRYQLLGEEVVVVRFEDGLLATVDACPHKGMRLSCGSVARGELVCAYHGWRFGADGQCVGVPSLPDPPQRLLDKASLQTFDVQERYGLIWVKLDEAEAAAPLPDIPEFEGKSGWHYLVAAPMVFQCGFRREIENYLDMTHFAFAHGTTLGAAADVVLPPMDITRHDDGFQMDAPFPALSTYGTTPTKLQSAHHRLQRCYLPNFTTIRQTFEDGDERMLVHIPSPNTPVQCTVFWAIAQPDDFDGPALEEQIGFSTSVLEEDRFMCENQWPKEVPVVPSRGGWGVLVAPGDTLANTFQKSFRNFLTDHMAETNASAS